MRLSWGSELSYVVCVSRDNAVGGSFLDFACVKVRDGYGGGASTTIDVWVIFFFFALFGIGMIIILFEICRYYLVKVLGGGLPTASFFAMRLPGRG